MDIQGEIAATAASPRLQPVDISPRASGDYRRSLDVRRSVDANRRSVDTNRLSALEPNRLSALDAHQPRTSTSSGRGLFHRHKKSKSRDIELPADTASGSTLLKTASDNSLIQSVAAGPIDKRAADAITAHTHAKNIEAGLAPRTSTIEAGPAGTIQAGPSHAPEQPNAPDGIPLVVREVDPQAALDAAELDRALASLKEDPLGAVQLGEDGVMRSFNANRDIIDAVGLSPRLIRVWFARMPPVLRELLDENEFAGVDGTMVPRERMFVRDGALVPPALSKETLELRKKRMEEEQLEDRRLQGGGVVDRETTEAEEKKGVDVRNEEVAAPAEGSAEGAAGAEEMQPAGQKQRKGSREKCGFLTAAKRRIF